MLLCSVSTLSRGLSLCYPCLVHQFSRFAILSAWIRKDCYVNKNMPNKSKIPDRWEAYSKMGNVIQGTTIMPIKVPLRESLTSALSTDERFSPSSLLTLVQEKDLKLCGVVDLTYTTKYYDAQFFTDSDVGYRKVFTAGHVIPGDNTFEQFASAIKSLEKEGEVICVHCTHGLNRSGYMICRYMIEVLNTEPQTAIRLFEQARGHKIERQNYIDDLMCRAPGMMAVAQFSPEHPNDHISWRNDSTAPHHGLRMDESEWNNNHHCHRRNRTMAWKEKNRRNRGGRRHQNKVVGGGTVEGDQHIQNNPDSHNVLNNNQPTTSHGVNGASWFTGFHSVQQINNTGGYSGDGYQQWRRDNNRWNRQDCDNKDSKYDMSSGRNQGPYGRGRGGDGNIDSTWNPGPYGRGRGGDGVDSNWNQGPYGRGRGGGGVDSNWNQGHYGRGRGGGGVDSNWNQGHYGRGRGGGGYDMRGTGRSPSYSNWRGRGRKNGGGAGDVNKAYRGRGELSNNHE